MKRPKLKPGDVTSNGVEIEIVHIQHLAIVGHPILRPLGAHRVSTGSWTVPCHARMALQLKDGRKIEVNTCAALKGKQVGRKPRVGRAK